MHKFNYKGCEFEIGLTTIESDKFIIARLWTNKERVYVNHTGYHLYIGYLFNPTTGDIVITSKYYTAIKLSDYEKRSGKSYADLINYLEELCKSELVKLEDVYKECEGKTPVEIKEILKEYEVRLWDTISNKFLLWVSMKMIEFDFKEAHKLGLRQIRRKETRS